MLHLPLNLGLFILFASLLLRNGIERLRAGVGVLHNTEGIRYEPKYVVPFIKSVQAV